MKNKLINNSATLAELVVKGLQEKKAKDIVVLDLREVDGAVTDFFVVCHGDSSTHVDGLMRSTEEHTRVGLGEKPWHREGTTNSQWILLDYFSVVVHIFQKEYRDFYNIEGLWGDAEIQKIEDDNEL